MYMYYWQELLCAVDQCFKALPTSEHKSLAQKWVGSGDEFMTFDLMSDPVLLTKYNAMVHKAHQLKRAQVTIDAPSCLLCIMHSCTATTPVSPPHYSLVPLRVSIPVYQVYLHCCSYYTSIQYMHLGFYSAN